VQLRAEDIREKRENNKLLLLGAGESGKSTLLKQLRILYGKGFSPEERAALRGVIHANTITCIQMLITVGTYKIGLL
jgi:energy-coupling factor transporter ATP-binding protein EcfA2